MLITTNNLYDICFPEEKTILAYATYRLPLIQEEQTFLKRSFEFLSIDFGSGGDYQVETELKEGLFILKPHFFYKREGDGVCEECIEIIEQYGGTIITTLYDIMEKELKEFNYAN
jgi:hypothetical protein